MNTKHTLHWKNVDTKAVKKTKRFDEIEFFRDGRVRTGDEVEA